MVIEEGSSSSSPIAGDKYDVFVSFRGLDSRYPFADHLYVALMKANFTTFRAEDDIMTGGDLKQELKSAIKASRVSLIVLSRNFAHSKWLLEELVLILEQRRTSNHIVIPIYYHVDPSDVRKQQGSFGDAMAEHKQRMEGQRDAYKRSQLGHKIDQWNKALTEVAQLKGMDANGRQAAELIQDIVEEIKRALYISSKSHSEVSSQNRVYTYVCYSQVQYLISPGHISDEGTKFPPRNPLQVIKNCTRDFNERNFIGKGGYGSVYKGNLTWGIYVNQLVAVKRLDVTGFQGNKEFHTELTMLSQYHHKNIVTLIGFCDANNEMILVYEYASHGSLDTHLLNPSTGLSWLQLLKICIDIASALDYLHNHVAEKHRIIHRDIKSANILLDKNWNAKLADFGLAKIGLANQENTVVITNLAGTHGYCDPQYEETGFLTKESDVYSFGVVLFEVLCGRLACAINYHDHRRFLNRFAPTCYKNGELDKIIDPRIREEITPRALLKFSAIAYQCLQKLGKNGLQLLRLHSN